MALPLVLHRLTARPVVFEVCSGAMPNPELWLQWERAQGHYSPPEGWLLPGKQAWLVLGLP